MTYVRRSAEAARSAGRAALRAQAAEKLSRREERVITLLQKHAERYAYAMELYDAWAKEGGQRARSVAAIQAALLDANGRQKPEAQQLEYLRRQIEMRVLGLGWTEYATRWSSSKDSRIGTVAHLQELLEEIVMEERSRERFTRGTERGLPAEAAPPQGEWRDSLQLGTLDADAQAVRSQTRFNAQQLRQKAEQERQRRVEAGIADDVEARQPEHAPAAGREAARSTLEVLHEGRRREGGANHDLWSTGRVVRVADGASDKKTVHAARSRCPAGPCSGRGTLTPSSGRWRASSGSPCCPRSGIHLTRWSTAGAMTHVSSQLPPQRPHLTSAAATPHAWSMEE